MELTDTWPDAYGNQITVGDYLRWISLHCDITTNAVGGAGAQALLPPNLASPGHACLGGDDVVKALARIGQALHIAGYGPTKAE